MTAPVVNGVPVAPKDHAHGLYGGTAATLASVNPVLADKQVGLESDTGRTKIGDGVTAWNDLAYTDQSIVDSIPVRVTYAATENIAALTGLSAVDGPALADDDRVLLPSQTIESQGGIWLAHSGAWTRPADFASGSPIPSGKTIEVLAGDTSALTTWEVTGTGTVDTNVQTWTKLHDSLATVTDITAAVAALDSVYVTAGIVPASLAGLTDCTAAVQAIADLLPNGGNLHFTAAASTYNFAGTVTTAPGVIITISGDGSAACQLVSTAGLPIFEIATGATGNTDGFRISGVKLVCLVDADYASGLLALRWVRFFDIDIDIEMTGTGTALLLDTSYTGRIARRSSWRLGRYAVGIELDARLNPSAQMDGIDIEGTIFSVHGMIVRTGTGNIHGLRVPGRFLSSSPDKWQHVESTVGTASSVGDSTLLVASSTGFVAGQPVFIDYGVNVEVNEIDSVAAGSITLHRPLRFAHAVGVPVVYGGFCVSLSSWVRGFNATTTHLESVQIGVLADTPFNFRIGDAVLSSCSELVRFYNAATAVRVGQVNQGGSAVLSNYIVNDTNVTTVSDCWIDGPIVAPAATAFPPVLTTAGKFSVSSRLGNAVGNAPTVAAQAGLGTSPPTPTVSGTDHAGTVSVGTGTSTATGNILTVTFATPFATTPQVIVSKGGNYAGTVYKASASTTGFSINVSTALAASQPLGTFTFDYMCVGSKVTPV